MIRTGKTSAIRQTVILCWLLTSAPLTAWPACAAGAAREEDLRADIVYRCYNLMGEFGAAGVDACVQGDLSAMRALLAYPPENGEIVQRCTRNVQIIGWHLAKLCADEEIAAEGKAGKD